MPLWAKTTKITDWRTEPLAYPFARSLAPLTHSLAPHYSLCSRPLLCSLICSLARLLVGQWLIRWLFILCFSLIWPIVHAGCAYVLWCATDLRRSILYFYTKWTTFPASLRFRGKYKCILVTQLESESMQAWECTSVRICKCESFKVWEFANVDVSNCRSKM